MEFNLEGVIVSVKIDAHSLFSIPYANLISPRNNDTRIKVYGGGEFLGEKCLVRLKTIDKPRSYLEGNFVKLFDDEDSQYVGLTSREVLFYSIWKKGFIPTIDELNEFYDPGQLGKFLYFKNGSNKEGGRYVIYRSNGENKKFEIKKSIKEIFESELGFNGRNPEMIIVDSKSDAYSIMKQCKKRGINAIKLREIAR